MTDDKERDSRDVEFTDDEEEFTWESSARSLVRSLLSAAEFDQEAGTVTLESDVWDVTMKRGAVRRTFDELEEPV